MPTAIRTDLSAGLRKVADRLATALSDDAAGDGELLRRFAVARDEAAFARLVRRHAGMVFGTCRRVLGNAADADDAFQAAFVVLGRKAHELSARGCVGGFLHGIAYHTALKAKAMAATRRAKEAKAAPPTPADDSDQSELLQALDDELAKLPEKYRGPVVLCELGGVPRRDAAVRLGVPEGTLSSRLATAHQMLRRRLAARGFAAVGVAALLANHAEAASEPLLRATVHAVVTGPSRPVARLITEVTKMLLLNKLRAGAAVLAAVALLLGVGFGVAPSGTAGDEKPAKADTPYEKKLKAEADEAAKLRGRWVSKPLKSNPADERKRGYIVALPSYVWTFDEKGLHTEATVGKEIHKGDSRYVLNPHATPKELNVVGDKTLLLCIYVLDGDKLTVAFYGRSEVDRPKGFDPKDNPKDADPLTVIEFARDKPASPDRKGRGDKKPDDAKLLVGEWVSQSVTFDPPFPVKPGETHTPANHVLTFTATEATWASSTPPTPGLPVNPANTRSAVTKKHALDQATSPKQLTIGDIECVYELDGDRLRVAMYFGSPGRPKGFTATDSPPARGGSVMVIEFAREKKPDDEKAVLGTWAVNEMRSSGQTLTDEAKKFYAAGGYTITFAADTMTHDLDKSEAKYRLDATGVPKLLELLDGDGKVVARGIYELNGDDLKVCLGRKPERGGIPTPPSGFDIDKAEAGTFPTLLVMKRQKPPEKKGDPNAPKTGQADEPKWKQDFRAAYGLKDGQLVRRVAPPYPDCRAEFLRNQIGDRYERKRQNTPAESRAIDYSGYYVVFGWKDGEFVDPFPSISPTRGPNPTTNLEILLRSSLGVQREWIVGDRSILELPVTGEFVIAVGADPVKVSAQLETILRDECGLMVSLAFAEREEENVFVLGGKYEANPLKGRAKDSVELYANQLTDRKPDQVRTGTFAEFVKRVESFVNRRVVLDAKATGLPDKVEWHYNSDPNGSERTAKGYAAAVLDRIGEQTGLTVTQEKRPVRVLNVTAAKAKK